MIPSLVRLLRPTHVICPWSYTGRRELGLYDFNDHGARITASHWSEGLLHPRCRTELILASKVLAYSCSSKRDHLCVPLIISLLPPVDISAPVELTARWCRQFPLIAPIFFPPEYIFHRSIHELHVLQARDACLERSLLNLSIKFTPVEGY